MRSLITLHQYHIASQHHYRTQKTCTRTCKNILEHLEHSTVQVKKYGHLFVNFNALWLQGPETKRLPCERGFAGLQVHKCVTTVTTRSTRVVPALHATRTCQKSLMRPRILRLFASERISSLLKQIVEIALAKRHVSDEHHESY